MPNTPVVGGVSTVDTIDIRKDLYSMSMIDTCPQRSGSKFGFLKLSFDILQLISNKKNYDIKRVNDVQNIEHVLHLWFLFSKKINNILDFKLGS